METSILPLAIAMMAGPQILSAIILTTHPKPVQTSLAWLGGVLTAMAAGLLIAFGLASLIGISGGGESGNLARIIELVLVGLLIYLAANNYINRSTIKPPKWIKKLQSTTTRHAFKVGLLLILLMPSDLIVMLTVGTSLAAANQELLSAIPFMALTLFIAALPLLGFLLFRDKAIKAMPGIRAWIDNNSWKINIAVYVLFIFLIL